MAADARSQARTEEALAVPLLISADRADRDQDRGVNHRDEDPADRDRGEELYDSAERRRQLAADLEGVADDETIEARVIADTNQGRPAHEAVAKEPTRPPTARRSRGKGGPTRTPARRAERGR